MYFLTSFLHYSSLAQDILLQTVCNVGMGYSCVLLVRLWALHPWLVGLVLLLLLLCLYLVSRHFSRSLVKKLEEEKEEVDPLPPNSELSPPVSDPLEASILSDEIPLDDSDDLLQNPFFWDSDELSSEEVPALSRSSWWNSAHEDSEDDLNVDWEPSSRQEVGGMKDESLELRNGKEDN